MTGLSREFCPSLECKKVNESLRFEGVAASPATAAAVRNSAIPQLWSCGSTSLLNCGVPQSHSSASERYQISRDSIAIRMKGHTVSTFGRFGSIFDFALFIVHVPTKGLSAASAKPHVSKAIASVRIFSPSALTVLREVYRQHWRRSLKIDIRLTDPVRDTDCGEEFIDGVFSAFVPDFAEPANWLLRRTTLTLVVTATSGEGERSLDCYMHACPCEDDLMTPPERFFVVSNFPASARL